jgi:aryl-alcohol dehydrogenase-like predicted oxidoreductase
MKYALLGDTGLAVSRVILGAMTFTMGNSEIPTVYKVDEQLADHLVGRALDAGVNFFDTADVYAGGDSERLLGKVLKARRSEVLIATKVGNRVGKPLFEAGLNRRHILWSVDQSLQRLGSEWIDVYIVHKEDPFTPLEETLQALDDIVRAGKVRYLGFSNWSAWRASAALDLQRANGWARFSHGQMYYSLLNRDVERDIIPMMRHYGIGLTVWSPLSGGFLSGKYTPATLSDPDNRYSGFDLLPFDKQYGFRLVEQMREIATQRGCSIAQIALGWLLSKRAVTSFILGASKVQQLEDNLAAVDVSLTGDEVSALDRATPLLSVYPNWVIDGFGDNVLKSAVARPETQ